MLIKNPKTGKETYIYSAIIKFTKKNGVVSDKVRVVIRSSKKGGGRKRDLKIPKEIDTNDLEWRKYKGKGLVATYHRNGDSENHDYTPFSKGGIPVPTGLCERLEDLVKDAFFENSNKTKHKK